MRPCLFVAWVSASLFLCGGCANLTPRERAATAAQVTAGIANAGIAGYRAWARGEVTRLRDKAVADCRHHALPADYAACAEAVVEPTFGNVKRADAAILTYAHALRAVAEGGGGDLGAAFDEVVKAVGACGAFFSSGGR